MESRVEMQDDGNVSLTAEIVCAYVGHNSLSTGDVPKLIAEVHAALIGLSAPVPVEELPELRPAVSVRKSVTPDHLVCLDCGKTFKSIKRHLGLAHNLTPAQYREKWSLPHDYSLVAANYSASRSSLAKSIGLGRKKGETVKKPAKRRVAARA
jgi:predicted transcriptional regulator